jgi:ABC-type phosphate/phosphonate transport system substrate-binding protein
MKKSITTLFLTMLITMTLFGCSNQEENNKPLYTLNIGILPDEDEAKLRKRFTPLFDYLANEIGIPYQLIIPTDYTELVNLFGSFEK